MARLATAVLRHRRSDLYVHGTVIAAEPALTRKEVPVSEFSEPISGCEAKRGSRHVPVHSTGSWRCWKCVSL